MTSVYKIIFKNNTKIQIIKIITFDLSSNTKKETKILATECATILKIYI